MFEFIHTVAPVDAIAGVHFALRRISYRASEPSPNVALITETEPATIDEKIGLKILKEITEEENAPIESLTETKAKKYKDRLLDIADELSEKQFDHNKEKAMEVLKEWETTPFDTTIPGFIPGLLSKRGVLMLSAYLILFTMALMFLLFELWPTWDPALQYWKESVDIFGFHRTLDLELRLILIAVAAGGLGSLVHALTSFADYVGNRRLASSWVLWYTTRPFIGMAAALMFYFVLHATPLLGSPPQTANRFYLIAALSSFVGFFSKQMTDKLDEVFSTLFRSRKVLGNAKRQDELFEAGPLIFSVDPAMGTADGGTLVSITGRFGTKMSVFFGDVPAYIKSVSPTSIVVVTPPHAAGSVDVKLTTAAGQAATQQAGYRYN